MRNGPEPTKYELGGCTFYIHPFDPFFGLKLLGDLQKAFVPVIGAFMGAGNKPQGVEELQNVFDSEMGMNSDALMKCTAHLDGEALNRLCNLILFEKSDYIFVRTPGKDDQEKINRDLLESIFVGNPFGLIKLAGKVLEVNFKDFLEPLKAGIGRAVSGLAKKNGI